MNSPSGEAPIYLHDLLHALQTAMGARPRPASGKSGEMVPVPVEVYLMAETEPRGEFAQMLALDVLTWRLQPHKPATADAPEVPARLYFACSLPAPFTLNRPADPDAVEPAAEPDPEPVVLDPTTPPELRHMDPAVWTADTSRPAGAGKASL